MNIAVLGANCKFSSDLAVRLNQLKKSSLVYRYDILADFKKDIPLYKSLLISGPVSNKQYIDIDDEVEMPENILRLKDRSPLGEYIGDIETRFLDTSLEGNNTKIEILRTVFNTLNIKIEGVTTYGEQCTRKKYYESEKNSQLFLSNALNILNVYSGIVSTKMLNFLVERDPLTVIVKVKNSNGFILCDITDEDLEEITKKNPQSIVLKVNSLNELLKNNFFISTFNIKEEKEKKEEIKLSVTTDPQQGTELLHVVEDDDGMLRIANPPDRVVLLNAA